MRPHLTASGAGAWTEQEGREGAPGMATVLNWGGEGGNSNDGCDSEKGKQRERDTETDGGAEGREREVQTERDRQEGEGVGDRSSNRDPGVVPATPQTSAAGLDSEA